MLRHTLNHPNKRKNTIVKNANIYGNLVFYKELLINSKIAYRINPTESSLSCLQLIQRLHDDELARVRHTIAPKVERITITNDLDFEEAISLVLN